MRRSMRQQWEYDRPHREHQLTMLRLGYHRMSTGERAWMWIKIVLFGPFVVSWLALEWLWNWSTDGALRPHNTIWGWIQWSSIYCLCLYPIIDRPLWPGLTLSTATILAIHVRAWRNRGK